MNVASVAAPPTRVVCTTPRHGTALSKRLDRVRIVSAGPVVAAKSPPPSRLNSPAAGKSVIDRNGVGVIVTRVLSPVPASGPLSEEFDSTIGA